MNQTHLGSSLKYLDEPFVLQQQTSESKAEKLDEQIINQEEKRLTFCQDLMNFIRRSNAITHYDTLFQHKFVNPVFIEVEADLVLSSLCSRSLDEAVAHIMNDLSYAFECLQGAAAKPPNIGRIKEILTKARDEENCGELRVDVTFVQRLGPLTWSRSSKSVELRLFGYTRQVKKLKQVLETYLKDELLIETNLDLVHSELVDCFDRLLDLIDIRKANVTIEATHRLWPWVTVFGPRRDVQQVHDSLTDALAKLITQTLDLEGPGMLRYFQTDGKEAKELMEASHKVIAQEKDLTILVVGLCRWSVADAVAQLERLFKDQCSTLVFAKKDLEDLTPDDRMRLRQLAWQQRLYLEEDPGDHGGMTVCGGKAGVHQVVQMFRTIIPLRREIRTKEEEVLYSTVAWCIHPSFGSWERLPKAANYDLEKNADKDIEDASGNIWCVNPEKTEATRLFKPAKLKRLVNLPDFTFPLYWDCMAPDENLKEVLVLPCCEEFQRVVKDFNKSSRQMVLRVVRLQNVHLRRAYEAKKKHISDKNKLDGGAGERILYHGTSPENCASIKTGGFNRSFSGKNATAYGVGTYFAVDASYSADTTYSKPAADGTQTVFVARVLTGNYTRGRSSMRVPPPRSSFLPHDRYDSLVDNMLKPNLFVVFHDDQAYPDYLITFISSP